MIADWNQTNSYCQPFNHQSSIINHQFERGIALIVVLWTVIILSVIGGSVLAITGAERVSHALLHDQIKAEYLARGAVIELGVKALEFFGLPDDQRPPEFPIYLQGQDLLGRERPLGEGMTQLTLVDESSKINLNLASEAMLRGLFAWLKAPDPAKLAKAIVEWRTAKRLFLDLHELQFIEGGDASVWERIRPYLTLATSTTAVNANTASEAVLAAVVEHLKAQAQQQPPGHGGGGPAGLSPDAISSTIMQGRPWKIKKLQDDLGPSASAFTLSSRIYAVVVTGSVRGRRCTLEAAGDIFQLAMGNDIQARWRKFYDMPFRGPRG